MPSTRKQMLPSTNRYLLGALNYAVGAGEVEMARRIISTGIDINEKLNPRNYDLLYAATLSNNVTITGMILEATDSSAWDIEGQMGVEYVQVALAKNNEAMVRLLLEHRAGASVGVPFAFRQQVVSENDQLRLLELIRSVSTTNVRLHESIIGSASYGNLRVFERLLHWDPLTTRIFTTSTIAKALEGAAFFGHEDVVRKILDSEEMAPLLTAQRLSDALGCLCADILSPRPQRYARILEMLVEKGATSRQLNKYQLTCAFETKENMLKSRLAFGHEMKSCKNVDALVHFAALGNNVAAIKTLTKTFKWDVNLLAHVPYVNVVNTANTGVKMTALAIAARHNSVDAARYLLELGAKVDHRSDKDKLTPLHQASLNHNFEMIDILLKAGADVKLTCGGCLTALHLLVWHEGDNPEYVLKLLKRGANLKGVATSPVAKATLVGTRSNNGENDVSDKEKFSIVTRCCRSGGLESLRVLLKHGADVNSYTALLDEPPLTSACRVDDCPVWPHCPHHNIDRQKSMIDVLLPEIDEQNKFFQIQHAVDYCVGRNFELLVHLFTRCANNDDGVLRRFVIGQQSFLRTYGPLDVDSPGSLSTRQLIVVLQTIIRRFDRRRWFSWKPSDLDGFWYDHTPFVAFALLGECSGLPNDIGDYLAARASADGDFALVNLVRYYAGRLENDFSAPYDLTDDEKRALSSPLTLKNLARLCIRESIGRKTCDVNEGVRKLKDIPLPKCLIDFLIFKVASLI